jgi:hypothetical protein
MSKTTSIKLPRRSETPFELVYIATAFTRDDGQSTLRIENGVHTEVEMIVNRDFSLQLVALLIAHFEIVPGEMFKALAEQGHIKL